MSENNVVMGMGWQCPGCGACYGPQVARCWTCRGYTITLGGAIPAADPVCGACGKFPCDRSNTGCSPPYTISLTCLGAATAGKP